MSKDFRMEAAVLMAEINALAYLINECTDMCVFTRYYGHTSTLELVIAKTKEQYNDNLVDANVYTPSEHGWVGRKECIDGMKILKLRLKKILSDKNIDYSGLAYEIEEVRHYKLC